MTSARHVDLIIALGCERDSEHHAEADYHRAHLRAKDRLLVASASQDTNPERACLEKHRLDCKRDQMEAEVIQEESDLTEDGSENERPLVGRGELLEDVDPQRGALYGRDDQDRDVSKEVVVDDFGTPGCGHFENDCITRIAQGENIHKEHRLAQVVLRLSSRLLLRDEIVIVLVGNSRVRGLFVPGTQPFPAGRGCHRVVVVYLHRVSGAL